MEDRDTDLIQDYAGMAEDYDAIRYTGSAAEFRVAHALETAERMVSPTKGTKILDVAVGTGKGALSLAHSGARIVGVDFTDAMLRRAQQKARVGGTGNVTFVRGNAAKLPFATDEFDVVMSLNFLHLFLPVSKQRVFIAEMHRVLRPGGKLVIELINLYQGLLIGLARRRFGHDLGFNSPGDLRRLLSPEFEIVRVEGGHLPGLWRLLHALSSRNEEASRYLKALTRHRPWKYLAFNVFVEAVKA